MNNIRVDIEKIVARIKRDCEINVHKNLVIPNRRYMNHAINSYFSDVFEKQIIHPIQDDIRKLMGA